MKLTKIESYEIQAFAFRVMTGYMAPGKDVSPLACEAPYEERCAAWEEWRNKHAHCILAMLHSFEALIDRDDEPTGALRAEIDRLREWQRQMVEKAASGGRLDGYRELAGKLAAKDAENDRLRAALVAAMEVVQQDRTDMYIGSVHARTGELAPEDAEAIARIDAIIAQAKLAMGSEG